MKRRSVIAGAAVVIAAAVMCAVFLPQQSKGKRGGYPAQEITVVCPWVQGGGTDIALRALCKSAEKTLGVPLNVVNKAGDNGAAGFTMIRDAQPDGYTIGMITYELNSLPMEGLLDFTYEDMEPLVMVNADAVALAARIDAPYDTVTEFAEYAKKHPGEITVAQATPGSVWHVGAALFMDMAGLDVKFLPFEGTANAVTAAANGYTEVVAASVAEVKSQVDAGTIKLLGVMDKERSKAYPEVETFAEQGYEITYYTWRGLAAPKGLDPETKEVLEAAFTEAMRRENFADEMEAHGMNIAYKDSEEFRQFLEDNYKEVKKALDSLGLIRKD